MGVRQATDGLQAELRSQIAGAGLGERLARTWRSETYPRAGTSLTPAGLVWSKAPKLVRAFAYGALIRSRNGLFLAIPTEAAGRVGDGRKRITPGSWERRTGLRLRFVYRRGDPRCWSRTMPGSPAAAVPPATRAGAAVSASPGLRGGPPCRSSCWCRRSR